MFESSVNGVSLSFSSGTIMGTAQPGHASLYFSFPEFIPNAISAIARLRNNDRGVCAAIGRYLGVDDSELEHAVSECNKSQQIYPLHTYTPNKIKNDKHCASPRIFLLTPMQPDGSPFDEKVEQRRMTELLDICESHKIENLRMSQLLLRSPSIYYLTSIKKAILGHSPVFLKRIAFDIYMNDQVEIENALIRQQ